MEVKVVTRYIRISPKKMRLVANLIRNLPVIEAENQLKLQVKKAKWPIMKSLSSAVANAEHNFGFKKENLYIKKIFVDQGPSFKRWMPRARGRATPILKRTSHLTIILDQITSTKIKKPSKPKSEISKIQQPVKFKEKPIESIQIEEKEEKTGVKAKLFDIHRKGKRRHKEHLDKIQKKAQKGFLKRIFKRKTD